MRQSRWLLILGLVVFLSASWASSDCYVTILHLNDLHGYLEPVEIEGVSTGGIARISTLVEEVRGWNDGHGNATLFLNAGDILQGTPMSMIYHGEPDVKCLNLMGLDYMTVGNHEFDFGQAGLEKVQQMAKFPLLSANIYVQRTGERLTAPYALFTLPDGTRGAAIGLTSKDTAVETLPVNVEGLRFADPVAECGEQLKALAGQAEFLVGVTHLGYENDLELARQFPELDVIIGAHSHTVLAEPTQVGRTLVCQAGSYGRWLGQLDMFVQGGEVTRHRGFLRTIDGRIPEDPEIAKIVSKYASQLETQLGKVVATSTVDLLGERDEVRSQETNLGNLVCDLFREYTGAQIAIINGGGIRASISAGPITMGDVLKVMPFSNLVATKRVTGRQLREALEFAAGLERPSGGFLQVSGLEMVIRGKTLQAVKIQGEPLDDKAEYTLATSEFLLAGGDGFAALARGEEPKYLGFTDNAILSEMLTRRGSVSPQVEGRIVIEAGEAALN
ncbi:MAG: hypothetical protein GX100_08215 [candidate division WS1 bacterium]|nr:hypothetical protein [candidate division WS1 bacterium]